MQRFWTKTLYLKSFFYFLTFVIFSNFYIFRFVQQYYPFIVIFILYLSLFNFFLVFL